jgi:hypothetical protein
VEDQGKQGGEVASFHGTGVAEGRESAACTV